MRLCHHQRTIDTAITATEFKEYNEKLAASVTKEVTTASTAGTVHTLSTKAAQEKQIAIYTETTSDESKQVAVKDDAPNRQLRTTHPQIPNDEEGKRSPPAAAATTICDKDKEADSALTDKDTANTAIRNDIADKAVGNKEQALSLPCHASTAAATASETSAPSLPTKQGMDADAKQSTTLQTTPNPTITTKESNPATAPKEAPTDKTAKEEMDKDEKQLENARIVVRRHVSAHGAVVFKRTGFVHLPHGDCGDGVVNPHSTTVVQDKYWAQRHRLFGRFEQGIQLDSEGWFSVMPKAIANHLAKKMTLRTGSGLVVLDAFVGVGGNAIAFAQREEVALVICCGTDPERLLLAANNCKVYNIPTEKVVFVCANAVGVLQSYQNGVHIKLLNGDANDVAKDTEKDDPNPVVVSDQSKQHGYKFLGGIDRLPEKVNAILLSPPWGGSEYANQRHFDLESIHVNDTVNGKDLFKLAIQAMPKDEVNVAYFLPRNTNGWRVGQSAYCAGVKQVEMEQNYLNNKLKTVTLYVRSRGGIEDGF